MMLSSISTDSRAAAAPSVLHRSVLFVDPAVENWQAIARGVAPDARAIALKPGTDGWAQLSAWLRSQPPEAIGEVHVLAHGEPGRLALGRGALSAATLDRYAPLLVQWRRSLATGAELLLWACDTGRDRELLAAIGRLTGASVAAASGLVGAAARGGSWNLDARVGSVTAPEAIDQAALAGYAGVLANTTLYSPAAGADPETLGFLTYGQIPTTPALTLGVLTFTTVPSFVQGSDATGTQLDTDGTVFQNVPSNIAPAPPATYGAAVAAAGGNVIDRTGYGGYANHTFGAGELTLVNPSFPTLDRNLGYTINFALTIANEDSNANRAGFSLTVTSSDGKGIELGFEADQIFAQDDGSITGLFVEAEPANFDTTVLTQYALTVKGDTYSLSANGGEILGGPLRDYSAFDEATSNPPLPADPYESPNFLFFGDNTDQGFADFTLGAISVEINEEVQPPASDPVQPPPPPDLELTDRAGNPIDTRNPLTLASTAEEPGRQSFLIFNRGGTNLSLSNLAASEGFSIVSLSRDSVPPGAAALLVVQFNGTADATGTLSFASNDPDSRQFSLRLAGTAPAAPERSLLTFEEALQGIGSPEVLSGGDDSDTLTGGPGNQGLRGDDGDDLLFGNQGQDALSGGNGNDTIYGGKGNDYLFGDDGDDLLAGDFGNDLLITGDGADRIVLGNGRGTDTVLDFAIGSDSFLLEPGLSFADLTLNERSTGTEIFAGDELLVKVLDVAAADLPESKFVPLT